MLREKGISNLTSEQISKLEKGEVLFPKKESPTDSGKSFRTAVRKFGRNLNANKILILLGKGDGYKLISLSDLKNVSFVNCWYGNKDGKDAQDFFLKSNEKKTK